MKKSAYFRLILLSTTLLLFACNYDQVNPDPGTEPYVPTPYTPEIPIGLPALPNPEINPMTVEGVALGRSLYYDNILSMNGQACASCHNQRSSFSASGPGPTGTDILAHINLGYNPNFGWTGGESILDHVALADLVDGNVFLDANNDSILARLSRHKEYQDMFRKAFGIDIVKISEEDRHEYIAFALAQFMRTLISGNSRFDKFARREPGADFTQSEFNGYNLFFSEKGDCFHCHGYPLFSDNDFHNNGLDASFSSNRGRYDVTGNNNDMGRFGTPTLRNIAYTAPYMHDGRFQTLEQVIEHYNSGVQHSATLDPIMTKAAKVDLKLGLTPEEVQDLVAFLHTLTDTAFMNNPNLGSPF